MRLISMISFILLVTWLSTALAAAPKCVSVPFTVDGKNIILPGTPDSKKPVIYFFQNKSMQSLWLDHTDPKRRGTSAGWASYLRPDNWSAIVLNKKSFSISCSSIQPGKVETLECSTSLSICAPQNMTTAKPLEGNYWMTEDKKWDSFVRALEKRGATFN
jgi:hypothetical protein